MSRRRAPLATLALIALAALICGCGSVTPAPIGTTGGRRSIANTYEKAVKFAECMRANGVGEFPDPGASGTFTLDGVMNGSSLNPSTPAWKRAFGTCKDLEPPGFTGRTRSTQEQTAALKFAQCVRENGVPEFPDPTPNSPLIDTNRIPSADGRGAQNIPGLRAAAHKCIAIYSAALGFRAQ